MKSYLLFGLEENRNHLFFWGVSDHWLWVRSIFIRDCVECSGEKHISFILVLDFQRRGNYKKKDWQRGSATLGLPYILSQIVSEYTAPQSKLQTTVVPSTSIEKLKRAPSTKPLRRFHTSARTCDRSDQTNRKRRGSVAWLQTARGHWQRPYPEHLEPEMSWVWTLFTWLSQTSRTFVKLHPAVKESTFSLSPQRTFAKRASMTSHQVNLKKV